MPLIAFILKRCLYVLLTSFERIPVKIPIPKNGIRTPKENTAIMSGNISRPANGTIEAKSGAMHGSRK